MTSTPALVVPVDAERSQPAEPESAGGKLAAWALGRCDTAGLLRMAEGDPAFLAVCHYVLGESARLRGRPEESRRHFRASLELDDRTSRRWSGDWAKERLLHGDFPKAPAPPPEPAGE